MAEIINGLITVIVAVAAIGLFLAVGMAVFVMTAEVLGVIASIFLIGLTAVYWVVIYPIFVVSKWLMILVGKTVMLIRWLIGEVVWAAKTPNS